MCQSGRAQGRDGHSDKATEEGLLREQQVKGSQEGVLMASRASLSGQLLQPQDWKGSRRDGFHNPRDL